MSEERVAKGQTYRTFCKKHLNERFWLHDEWFLTIMPNLKQAGLGLAIPLFECGDGLLMEEELEPLLGVVVAQFLKRGSGRPEKIIK